VQVSLRHAAASEQEAQELAEQVQIRFQEAGGKLEIKADKPTLRRSRISISYNITTPRQSSLDCESGSGSLKVKDLTGNVNARTGSGSVEAARIKGARLPRQRVGHADNSAAATSISTPPAAASGRRR
jgi:hypothetical protein